MTGSASDPLDWQRTSATSRARGAGAALPRPADPFRIVIVRDMWLTGFDAPSLHTMYVDKPMRGHGLMQAIARVNRVFKDKPAASWSTTWACRRAQAGARDLHRERRHRRTALDQAEAVALMLEKYESAAALPRLRSGRWDTGTPQDALRFCPRRRSTSSRRRRQGRAAAAVDRALAGLRARGAA
jgi:type I restriction enzyme R subunit